MEKVQVAPVCTLNEMQWLIMGCLPCVATGDWCKVLGGSMIGIVNWIGFFFGKVCSLNDQEFRLCWSTSSNYWRWEKDFFAESLLWKTVFAIEVRKRSERRFSEIILLLYERKSWEGGRDKWLVSIVLRIVFTYSLTKLNVSGVNFWS